MPGRNYTNGAAYRYGYQGSEKDDEAKGNGNSYNTDNRLLDPRLGRWLSMDPETAQTPFESPYASMGNNPILNNDPEGDIVRVANFKTFLKLTKAFLTNSDARNILWKQMFAKRHYERETATGRTIKFTRRAVFTYEYNSNVKNSKGTDLTTALNKNQNDYQADEDGNVPTYQSGPENEDGYGGGYYATFFEWKTITINKIGMGRTDDPNGSTAGSKPKEFNTRFRFAIIQSIQIEGAANQDPGNEIVSFQWHNNTGSVTLPRSSSVISSIGVNSANETFSGFDGAKGREVRSPVKFTVTNPTTDKGGPNAYGSRITIKGR